MKFVDRDKIMVWTFIMASLAQKTHQMDVAAKQTDLAVKEFERRRNEGFFDGNEKDDRT